MLISLNWLRDYVDLPADLDPHELAERFTCTTAEVETVERIDVGPAGLIAARVEAISNIPDAPKVSLVTLDTGSSKAETVSAAPALSVGRTVVFAPDGAWVSAYGTIESTTVGGQSSAGMVLPGSALGISLAQAEAVFLSAEYKPGDALDTTHFNDWVIEVDNKSITHRPDLWGHYGIAREVAAIFNLPLKPYPVVAIQELQAGDLPEIPISIADPEACRRYSGLLLTGVPTQPAPLWMQLRLGHIGLRPISGLVDLTNYIMADLGQPMHAFDAGNVDRIEVDWAKDGERFCTLDGVKRELTGDALMIQSNRRSIALAGVMGGLDTEVHDDTTSLLLESANFEPATIRRTATRLGLRTDASARFEKSLDPANTVLAIQRFIALARPMYPEMKMGGRLSDGFPNPPAQVKVAVAPRHVARTIGRDVPLAEAQGLLRPLGFEVDAHDGDWQVSVPSYRAANDVAIEADVIEELARRIGYDAIDPDMPRVSMRRFEPHALHELEQRTIEYFTSAYRYHEVHGYLWYDAAWLAQIGVDPGVCVTLKNPASEGLNRMRRDLLPGLLSVATNNRLHYSRFSVIEVGSVFERGDGGDQEYRHVGLVSAAHGKNAEQEVFDRLKMSVQGWAWQRFAQPVRLSQVTTQVQKPWEHPYRTAMVTIGDRAAGRVSVIDLPLRRAMDEHLSTWTICWAELRLSGLEDTPRQTESLGTIPPYPVIALDFTFQVADRTRFMETADKLAGFCHPLLKSIRFMGSYQGGRLPVGRRSITVRVHIGANTKTLKDADANGFREAFQEHIVACGYEL